ncbi:acyl-CoA thioesterase [Bacillus sp. FJAT-42376]|uniref:acyl-CoA thioesterase n=1 Tax=Bacillus sp. FJAT-42376 TaxID=2014076 RepID=UPI000F4E7898|nr:thioesterase family protein [Bacillus sp. FJAT-42376]AZB44009.1 acyl-CoA thioesterase [Bacillus sp. FJAT-42376]
MQEAIQVKVRFCETDALGHVNNTSYFIYLEEARVEFFGKLGRAMTSDNFPFILASASCDFMEQAYFNQMLTVKTAISKVGGKSFHLEHLIEDAESGRPIAKGKAAIVYFNFELQKSEEIPDDLRSKLETYIVHV